MAIEIVKVKVRPLSREAMKPYGDILDEDHPILPTVDPGEGAVAFEINTLERNGNIRDSLERMAIHGSYTQSFVILSGTIIMVFAPAPANMHGRQEELDFDWDNLGAFIMGPGDFCHIDRGVWHGALVTSGSCRFINVTRKNPGEGTTMHEDKLKDIATANRPYIEWVNVTERDGKRIALEL
jgi:ureidoglycolate hydrolase